MVLIKIEGADQYLAMQFSKVVEPKLSKELGINEDEINFICPETFFVHNGQEQTSFHVLLTISLPLELKNHEHSISNILFKELKNLSVHSHIIFSYFDSKEEFDSIDNEYPLYLTETNMVNINNESEDNNNTEEPYMGNVFEDVDSYVKAHPDISEDQATDEFYKSKTNK